MRPGLAVALWIATAIRTAVTDASTSASRSWWPVVRRVIGLSLDARPSPASPERVSWLLRARGREQYRSGVPFFGFLAGNLALSVFVAVFIGASFVVLGVVCWIFWRAAKSDQTDG